MMTGNVLNRIDYVAEAYALLLHIGTKKKYQELKESMKNKYQFSNEASEKKFKVLMQIEKQAEKKFADQMDRVTYYFNNSVEESGCIGKLLLLWDEFDDHFYGSLDDLEKNLNEKSEEEYNKCFGTCLQGYCDIIRDDSTYDEMTEPMQIIQYLMKMEIPDEEKWKIQKVYLERKPHQDEVIGLLRQAIAILKQNEKGLTAMTEWFVTFWTDIFEKNEFKAYVTKMMGVQIDDNPQGYIVRPTLIATNQLGIHAEAGDDRIMNKTPYFCSIGIMFDDDFSISPRINEREVGFEPYMLQVLKLIADKSKFEILAYIKDKRAYGSELAKHLDLTTATISHHMNGLVGAGLVKMEKEDARVYYSCNTEALEEVLDYCKMRLAK